MAASEPVSISIPAIDVDSVVNPIGLAEDGSLAVPTGEEYDEAAWFSGSPTPGEAGPAVVEGHVTSSGSTPSVFFELAALTAGDEVSVDRADGSSTTFEVYRVESYAKDDFPTGVVYGNTEGPELRLITCGGEYDPDDRRHLDNTVVYARMTPAGSLSGT
jgi:sortase (surface protein transpeptidase)